MNKMQQLSALRKHIGPQECVGLDDASIEKFLQTHKDLALAIEYAYEKYESIKNTYEEILSLSDSQQIKEVQKGFVNFYDPDTVNPYVALAAKGPWIITTNGAVIHDNGGYGMLGFGHNPDGLTEGLDDGYAMANIMTAQFTQIEFRKAIEREIGHRRGECPYAGFMCLNSGSEAMTLALRFADINTKKILEAKKQPLGKTLFVSLKGGFHGRTERPARISDSSFPKYQKHLASYQGERDLVPVAANDHEGLKRAFADAKAKKTFIEAVVLEPVMGEGNPGQGILPSFYTLARELCTEHSCLLIIDSIQAGLRTHGVLSICDYPGFERVKAPDIECFSKAINAGQYPLSVLALNKATTDLYQVGVYGNTMTTNPKAMHVATKVLESLTPELRQNIKVQGENFLRGLKELKKAFPDLVEYAQGTGLLFSLGINPHRVNVVGATGLEMELRKAGLGVIHGGENALRFTPHFRIQDDEVNWVLSTVSSALKNLSVKHGSLSA